jgi:hypothetical protein
MHGICEDFAVHARAAKTFGATNTIIGGDVSSYSVSTGVYTLIDGEVADLGNSTLFEASATASWAEATAFRADAQNIPAEIGGFTFTPGTWHSSTYIYSSATTTVVLDGQGDSGAEFLFQSEGYLSLGANTKFVLINGTKWENVLWACKTYFTAGADVDFAGSMLAGTYIVLGADVIVRGCIVSLSAITFGADNTITVARTMDSASPSITVTASPTATPSHSPPSLPSVSPSPTAAVMGAGCDADLDFSSSRKTRAVVEILENKCPEDIQLIAINGTTEYGNVPPIHILSQDQETVTFQVHQHMFPGSISHMYTYFHTAPNGDSRCLANASVTQSDTLIFTAGCMHMTPLSIVDLWVVDAALDADYDTAQLSDRCYPLEDAVLPTVQYTFKLHCVSQCVPTE